ncbi:HEPN domain-containing protein [Altibacter sp. HG106]|uniref:HEPN domain-containing protein n=1 Tax=Altibacter sp. HG106 TaxID=3023937 RepID=UPI00235095AF|nr:HEPN domain-containing protein [Altibacter sp. HG106]MDC7996380.1 HEPN domain-containing protein [Altibacter sp. HG106]
MGRAKIAWMEMQQERDDTALAERLGITYDELYQTDWHMEPDESKDGILYQYIVYFHDGPQDILDKIDGLNSDNQVWLEPYDEEDYDFDDYDYQEEFDAIIANKAYYDSFHKEVRNLEKLNNLELENQDLQNVLIRQLYISAIGTLETFLSETFINQTDEKPEYFKNFVETFPDFDKRKFPLSEIFIHYDNLKSTARKEMLKVIYHNLDVVQNMFIATFKIRFPDIAELSKLIATRHDLVHRNGKTKDGNEVSINKDTITELLSKTSNFVEQIAIELNLKG